MRDNPPRLGAWKQARGVEDALAVCIDRLASVETRYAQIDKEENAKLDDVLFRWLTHDEGVRMDGFDAEVSLGD